MRVRDPLDASFTAAVAALSFAAPIALDRPAYIVSLCHSWHTARATPPALRRAAARFAALGDEAAARLAMRKADEETGHDALVLQDLAALGLPDDLPERVCSRHIRRAVRRYHDWSAEPTPYGVFGHLYALERFAAAVTPTHLVALQALAPPGRDVTRSRRIHSGEGDDADHVLALAEFVACVPDAARTRIEAAMHLTVHAVVAAAIDPAPRAALARHLATSQTPPVRIPGVVPP